MRRDRTVSKPCPECGKTVSGAKSKIERAGYCSRECAGVARSKRNGSGARRHCVDCGHKIEHIRTRTSRCESCRATDELPDNIEQEIKRLYREGYPARFCDRVFGLSRNRALGVLKRARLFDASRVPPQRQKGFKGRKDPTTALLKSAFFAESKSISRYDDELRHWERHPIAAVFRRRRSENRLRANSPQRRLKLTARVRIWKMLKRQGMSKQRKPTESFIGCSISALRQHIESQFDLGMSWANYGSFWEVDHIRPCASFDLTDPKQQAACFHFSNLRPLPKSENRQKHSTWRGRSYRHPRLQYLKAA